MIFTLYYILNLPRIWDKIFDIIYTYNPEDEEFMTGYNEKQDLAYFQTGILGVLGIGIVGFIEGAIYILIRNVIV